MLKTKFLAILALSAMVTGAQSPQVSPRDVLERFCELDAQGKLLDDGWRQVAELFVSPVAPRRKEIIVIKDFVVSKPALEGSRAEFYVEYIELGKIDATTASFAGSRPMKVRAGFHLVLRNREQRSELDTREAQLSKTASWKIEGTFPESHLTVDAAIKFATDLRNNTADDVTKRNANRTISSLNHFKLRP